MVIVYMETCIALNEIKRTIWKCGWIDVIKQQIHKQRNTRKCMIELLLLTDRLNEFKMHFW